MRTTSFKSRAFALVSTTALLATLVVASPANASATGPTCDGKTPVQTCTGTTSDGAAYKMVVPATFNGTATIWSHGFGGNTTCLLYTSPSPRDRQKSRMPSSA